MPECQLQIYSWSPWTWFGQNAVDTPGTLLSLSTPKCQGLVTFIMGYRFLSLLWMFSVWQRVILGFGDQVLQH